jgi:hypothetical protein
MKIGIIVLLSFTLLTTLSAQDGGMLSGIGEAATLDGDGAVSFQFHVSDQPGLYRVEATAGGSSVGLVQFEASNPPE